MLNEVTSAAKKRKDLVSQKANICGSLITQILCKHPRIYTCETQLQTQCYLTYIPLF